VEELINSIKKVLPYVKNIVKQRIKEFEEIGKSDRIFIELCFCILTANFNAERCMKIQEKIGNGFFYLPEEKLAKKLKKLGHRYPNMRAKHIVEARKYSNLKEILESFRDGKEAREWLIKNIKGIGYKEASHFLRNIGYKDVAIIDFHILDLLERYKIIKKPKVLTPRKYLEIERILEKIAKKVKISLAELDLYLWYIETGKILK